MSTVTEINAHTQMLTLINTFTVRPDRQVRLIDLLERATEEVMRHRAGFISANIHRGLDGTTVVNYAQWASSAAFEAMLADPIAQEHMREIMEIADSSPGLYEVASVHRR